MSSEALSPKESARALDPNVLQRRAAMPDDSIWVNASAGTGKTKVLTDRVLRLLLPREDGRPGTPAHKILGLTFTKAGANEMDIRISKILAGWAIWPDDKLDEALDGLLGRGPNDDERHAARRLFADVIDTPGRLKIMTIHAFCQSALTRFPLEAKLTPGFQLAEERAAKGYLLQAKQESIQHAYSDKASPAYAALVQISQYLNEDQFLEMLTALARERRQLDTLLTQHFGVDGIYTALCTAMGVPPGNTRDDLMRAACDDAAFNREALRQAAVLMIGAKGVKDQAKGAKIADWLAATSHEDRIAGFKDYQSAFLTKDKNAPLATLMSKGLMTEYPALGDAMWEETDRIVAVLEACNAAEISARTRDLFMIGTDILARYARIKTAHNVLDYEDLIFKTLDLLKNSSAWVQFKLDRGIEHILIDEAQDTNPEQWQIIEALCEEFYAGAGASNDIRTVFTVGDEKQSIYSFQRASPEEFARMQGHFAQKVQAAQQRWNRVDLNISFRSLQCVLDSVDAVFSDRFDGVQHHAYRRGQAGCVELWPLCESDEDEVGDTWEPPITITEQKSGASKLADKIAKTIRGWMDSGEQLSSHGRAIEAGDIMVLVRTRNAFVHQLIRALKIHDIPVGGLDRIVLGDQLVIQDLLAAAHYALFARDDLTLACLLKSPLIGVDEDALFALAHDRQGTLAEAVHNGAEYSKISAYLRGLENKAAHLGPYGFFTHILQSPCPANDVSGLKGIKKRLGIDALDALDEFLNSAAQYERDNTPSLQAFLQWQASGEGDIKRAGSETASHVRIMTVHGSKGLQAPIVFLPDTTGIASMGGPKADGRLLWPNQSGLELPIWTPRASLETALYSAGKDVAKMRIEEEYRRLLYVAMTRAEDRLYIGGYLGKKKPSDECWYHLMKQGMKALHGVEVLETPHEDGHLRYSAPQMKEPDREASHSALEDAAVALPDWVCRPAPAEPYPPAPLVPSRPSQDEPAALSPLKGDDGHRFKRGNLTHTLLQFLPDISREKREDAGVVYLEKQGAELGPHILADILRETIAILDDPTFAPIFGEGSRAEVPITGLLPDGRLISGQIDRLLVRDDEILIVDYKTNRPPPLDPADIPLIYRNQMKAYADTLATIYPDRTITCALLWTDGPRLVVVR